MKCAIYGKLPAKRDFIAIGAPREFLAVWEPWMQGGLSASRLQLGEAWQGAFLRAPIWRFWLGADLCGVPLIGAFMPSVDGVGRYFPLSVFARPDAGETLAPPEFELNDAWLAQAEDVLLSVLADGATFEALNESLSRLPGPPAWQPPNEDVMRRRDGTLVARLDAGGAPAVLPRLRIADQARLYAGMSFWWTAGGEGFAPWIIQARRMPDPHLFTAMLTGRLDDHGA